MQTNKDYYLKCGLIYSEDDILREHFVRVTNGVIAEITDSPCIKVQVLDFSPLSLLPGFLDLHVHGREGHDVMDATPEALEVISTSLAKHGVVGFLATTVTSTWEQSVKAFSNIGRVYKNQPSGALLLGAYNEGLFFTADHKGAHDENYFLPLTIENIENIVDACNGALKVFALAPELSGSSAIIKYLADKGIKPMLGHTDANYQQTCDALHAGACGGVHVFNGMRGIHHRDPGCAGAVLLEDTSYVEVIADGVHLHPAILQMIYRLKGPKKMGLISDCIVAGGMKDGVYKLGMLDVTVKDGVARTDSGSLAGSTLTLEKAVKNLIHLANIPALEAVHMASLRPAEFLGMDNELGSISIGKRACFTLVDKDYNINATIIDGKFIYQSNNNS